MPARPGLHAGCHLPLHAIGCPDWTPEESERLTDRIEAEPWVFEPPLPSFAFNPPPVRQFEDVAAVEDPALAALRRSTAGRARPAHRCPRPGCDERTPRARLACRADWFALPADIRAAITQTYRRGQTILTASEAYLAALHDALEWYAANPRAEG